jgi:hypothetical protein
MLKAVNCAIALLASCLVSCASDSGHSDASTDAGRATAIEAEKNAAMNAYADCVRQRAQNLDDGSSDPTLIALAVQPDCKDQYSRYAKIGGIGMDSRALSAYNERLDADQTQLTSAIILKMRAQKTR